MRETDGEESRGEGQWRLVAVLSETGERKEEEGATFGGYLVGDRGEKGERKGNILCLRALLIFSSISGCRYSTQYKIKPQNCLCLQLRYIEFEESTLISVPEYWSLQVLERKATW